jgi:hypothetical protein
MGAVALLLMIAFPVGTIIGVMFYTNYISASWLKKDSPNLG